LLNIIFKTKHFWLLQLIIKWFAIGQLIAGGLVRPAGCSSITKDLGQALC